MNKIWRVSLLTTIVVLSATLGFAAWDKTKPANNEKLKDSPALIRANWDAIETGTDSALQITNAKVAATAAIVDTKLATISTAGKVSGAALTSMGSIPAGGGQVPVANGGTGASTAQTAINALAGATTDNQVLQGNGANIVLGALNLADSVTGTLATGNGGTGATANANAANGVCVMDSAGFPVTASAAPTTNYQVANKKYVDDSLSGISASGYSNVIFEWHGVSIGGSYNGLMVDATLDRINNTYLKKYYFSVGGEANYDCLFSKFVKIAGVSTITIYANGHGNNSLVKCTISGNVATATQGAGTAWTSGSVSVSGLTNGTAYDLVINFNGNGSNSWLYDVVVVGS